MKSAWIKMLAVPLLFMLSGCATIVSGTTQKISVSSQPSGADARADGSVSIKTPGHLTLDRKNEHTIEFSKEGYKSTTVFIRKTLNEMATGNVLLGGIIGVGIDAASGSGNKLIPERIDVVLEPGEGQSDQAKFSTQKDQEYYEKNVLKAQIAADQKKAEREAKEAQKIASSNVVASAVGDNVTVAQTGSNFGPKAR